MQESTDGTRSSISATISDVVVSKLRQYTGRGATEARAIIDRDVVTVVMRDVLTKGERILATHGDVETVLAFRRAFQDAMRDELCGEVSRITGREVTAFMSGNTAEPDYCVQVFVLGAPVSASGAPARLDGYGPVVGIDGRPGPLGEAPGPADGAGPTDDTGPRPA